MNRKEFLKNSIGIGSGLPFLGLFLEGCSNAFIDTSSPGVNFSGKVLIVGAGAAGLTAGYILQRNNIDFEIIEASAVYGGRVKRTTDLADFPIDLGGEWIHEKPSVLSEIINDPSVNASIDFVDYTPQTIQWYKNGKLKDRNWTSDLLSEHKFKSTTWFGFFENYIVPKITNKIRYNQPVSQIDYSGERISVTTNNRTAYEADKVLVTVPVKILQSNMIEFIPALPSEKTANIQKISMDAGLKVFIEFSERFYPDMLFFEGLISAFTQENKSYYNAAFGKATNKHVLGLFAINEKAEKYTRLGTDQAIFEAVMAELDEIFDGKASPHYLGHVVQNWSAEPYIQGSYSDSFDGNRKSIVRTIVKPLNNKVYFAGEAFSIDNQATVHGACESAYSIMKEMLI